MKPSTKQEVNYEIINNIRRSSHSPSCFREETNGAEGNVQQMITEIPLVGISGIY